MCKTAPWLAPYAADLHPERFWLSVRPRLTAGSGSYRISGIGSCRRPRYRPSASLGSVPTICRIRSSTGQCRRSPNTNGAHFCFTNDPGASAGTVEAPSSFIFRSVSMAFITGLVSGMASNRNVARNFGAYCRNWSNARGKIRSPALPAVWPAEPPPDHPSPTFPSPSPPRSPHRCLDFFPCFHNGFGQASVVVEFFVDHLTIAPSVEKSVHRLSSAW
jgi:hypothetical protein